MYGVSLIPARELGHRQRGCVGGKGSWHGSGLSPQRGRQDLVTLRSVTRFLSTIGPHHPLRTATTAQSCGAQERHSRPGLLWMAYIEADRCHMSASSATSSAAGSTSMPPSGTTSEQKSISAPSDPEYHGLPTSTRSRDASSATTRQRLASTLASTCTYTVAEWATVPWQEQLKKRPAGEMHSSQWMWKQLEDHLPLPMPLTNNAMPPPCRDIPLASSLAGLPLVLSAIQAGL